MIYEGLQAETGEEKPASNSFARLALTALGTSIDSMAVGVSLSILGTHIGVTAAAIGLATFTMVTIGVMAGQYIGSKFGKVAELCGGRGAHLPRNKNIAGTFGLYRFLIRAPLDRGSAVRRGCLDEASPPAFFSG